MDQVRASFETRMFGTPPLRSAHTVDFGAVGKTLLTASRISYRLGQAYGRCQWGD
jgi:hypothetical protein